MEVARLKVDFTLNKYLRVSGYNCRIQMKHLKQRSGTQTPLSLVCVSVARLKVECSNAIFCKQILVKQAFKSESIVIP